MACDEFLKYVKVSVRSCTEKCSQFFLVVNFACALRSDSDIGLGYERITYSVRKFNYLINAAGAFYLACGRNIGRKITFFHLRFFFYGENGIIAYSGGYVEVRAQTGVLFEPEFVIGLKPVYFPVFIGKISHGLEHITVIVHVVNTVIFSQGIFQFGRKRVVGRIGNAKHIDAVFLQTVTKFPVSAGKLWRNKNKIHNFLTFFLMCLQI